MSDLVVCYSRQGQTDESVGNWSRELGNEGERVRPMGHAQREGLLEGNEAEHDLIVDALE